MRKIRVLHIIPNFGPGGAERLVLNLLEASDNERFETAAVSLYPETGTILEQEIRQKGLQVYYLDKHLGLDLRMIPELYHLFQKFKPDVVHTHLYVLRYVLIPATLCRIPVRIHTLHSIAQHEVGRLGKLVHQISFRLGGVVPVSISRKVANTVSSVYGVGIQSPVIYNGIPTRCFTSVVNGEKHAKEEMVLLHIGRFAAEKNHLLLIQAFARAIKDYPNMQLWLVGDGELRGKVEATVMEKGLQEKVSFLGIRSDIPQLLAKSDLFVLSSDYEGVPLTILEAMAAGKPVVATAVGGVPELVEEVKTGILVPPRDPEALAQAILRLGKDPEQRRRMGEAGRKRAINCFDIEKTARAYEDLYLELLRKRGISLK